MDDRSNSTQEGSVCKALVIGWDYAGVNNLWRHVDKRSDIVFSFILHPKHTFAEADKNCAVQNLYFIFEHAGQGLPPPDHEFLASLERDGVPTVNNMIMGDRVVSKLPYTDALKYATFLGKRIKTLIEKVGPTLIIGGFDALHSGIARALAEHVNVPWFALSFSVIPPGYACFCDRMTPGSRVTMEHREPGASQPLAEKTLLEFEQRSLVAPAYVEPSRKGTWRQTKQLRARLEGARQTLQKSGKREFLRFTEYRSGHSVPAAVWHSIKKSRARSALAKTDTVTTPGDTPYVFFGLHMQPESSIDVWAPFYSNQLWVIETISRSIPPSHRLLVKIHKSDVSNYSTAALRKMKALPGVELVAPQADSRSFIEKASLVIAIQGTIGMEAALLGKSVIMLGESPVSVFPSVKRIGKVHDFPQLIRDMLTAEKPARREILRAFETYLLPFMPACHNDWARTLNSAEIDNFVALFEVLRQYVNVNVSDA